MNSSKLAQLQQQCEQAQRARENIIAEIAKKSFEKIEKRIMEKFDNLEKEIRQKFEIVSNSTEKQTIIEKKYTPMSKDELKALVDDESIYLGYIDTSNITDMSDLFYGSQRKDFSGIEKWNVSNVKNMRFMLAYCSNFDQDLSSWNVSNVENMSGMFYNCKSFDQDLNFWNVSNVTNMSFMFFGCKDFNQDISSWNTNNVTDMNSMFSGCKNFDQNLSSWDISNVTDIRSMFYTSKTSCKKAFGDDKRNLKIKN